MALDQYFEEYAFPTDALEDKSCMEKWNSASRAIADTDRNASNGFDCNICLESVQEPVVTLCGHLYCWPCIYKWLNFHAISPENDEEHEIPRCPVCKSQVSQSSLVPLYGPGQTTHSKGRSHCAGTIIPRRPLGPVCVHDSPRSSNTPTTSQPTSQFYQRHYPPRHHPQQHNAFDTTIGVFGEMIYARMFGNQLTNMYTYPNYSYNLAGQSNPRIRRHLMQADKSLSRICFFLLCCTVLCLLLF